MCVSFSLSFSLTWHSVSLFVTFSIDISGGSSNPPSAISQSIRMITKGSKFGVQHLISHLLSPSVHPSVSQGRVAQSQIKLTQFCNFLVRCSVYIIRPSVLNCSNFKLHQTLEAKNIFTYENVMLQLTFNPGLTLTGIRTTRPSSSAAQSIS